MIDDEANSQPLVALNLLELDRTTERSSYAGGDETDFLSGDGGERDGRGFSDMLVVSSSVRIIHRVHRHTASTGQATRGAGIKFPSCKKKTKQKKSTCNT